MRIRSLMGIAFLGLCATALDAQDRKPEPSQLLGGTIASLRTQLSLSAQQVADIEKIYEEFGKKLQATDRKQWRDLIVTYRRTVREKLDEKQKRKYEDLLTKLQFRGQRRGGGFLNVDELKGKLGLNDEQVKTIEQMLLDAAQDIRETAQEMRKEGAPQKEIQKEIQAVIQEYRTAIKGKLTEEQKAKFDAYLKERMKRFQKRGTNGRPKDRGKGRPGQNLDALIKKLGLDEARAAALRKSIQEIQARRRQLNQWNRQKAGELRRLLEKEAPDEEIQKRVEEMQTQRQNRMKEILDLRRRALEGLTPKQRAWILVAEAQVPN